MERERQDPCLPDVAVRLVGFPRRPLSRGAATRCIRFPVPKSRFAGFVSAHGPGQHPLKDAAARNKAVNDSLIAYLVRKSDAVKSQWPCQLFALRRATRDGLVYSRLLGTATVRRGRLFSAFCMPPLKEAATAVRRLMHEPSESHAFLLRRTQ